jgi:histone-lysine N-methyltransferase MLL5
MFPIFIINNLGNFFLRCNVSLRGNGVKVLTANSHIPANTPVIECRGKYMLASQLAGRGRAGDYVLFHRISPDLEVCVESKTYGNDSRFCRRADSSLADYNAEVSGHF